MEEHVRLFAGLRAGRFNRRAMDLADGTRLADLLGELGIPPEQVSLPLVNGRSAKLETPLAEGDVVSLFPAIGGG